MKYKKEILLLVLFLGGLTSFVFQDYRINRFGEAIIFSNTFKTSSEIVFSLQRFPFFLELKDKDGIIILHKGQNYAKDCTIEKTLSYLTTNDGLFFIRAKCSNNKIVILELHNSSFSLKDNLQMDSLDNISEVFLIENNYKSYIMFRNFSLIWTILFFVIILERAKNLLNLK